MDKLVVRGTEINVQWDLKRDDFLSLTDIAKIKDSEILRATSVTMPMFRSSCACPIWRT